MLNGVYKFNSETEMKILSVIKLVKENHKDYLEYRLDAEQKFRDEFDEQDAKIMSDIFALNYLNADRLLVWYVFKFKQFKVIRKSLNEIFYERLKSNKYYSSFEQLDNPYKNDYYLGLNEEMCDKLFLSNFMFTLIYSTKSLDVQSRLESDNNFIIQEMRLILNDQMATNDSYLISIRDNPYRDSTNCKNLVKLKRVSSSSNQDEYNKLTDTLDKLEREIENYGL